MTLRPYQAAAVVAAISYMRRSISPCMIEAATGAGKSHIIAEVARQIHEMTGKRVLCLAPSAELVTQNREKYLATGNKASMFSASAGGKETRHPVVFGSPKSVLNSIKRFLNDVSLVIVDEAANLTPTIRKIIAAIKEVNPNLRVLGFDATPYTRLGGYAFRRWPDGRINDDSTCQDPYFADLIYRITAPELIDLGFLVPPVMGEIGTEGYDTSALVPNSRGQFDAAEVDRAYHGHGRKTAAIVADVVYRSRDRDGIMFFGATIQHCQEIMASLPPSMSAMVTGDPKITPKKERERIIRAFKDRRIKYLVNRDVLTVGFDAPHVSGIAILRKTEAVDLWEQIRGRGMRPHESKIDCMIWDYTDNVETHFPDGDMFNPRVRAKIKSEGGGQLRAACPDCNHTNEFSANVQYLEYEKDAEGYILDLDGQRVMSDYGPISGHHGRRCFGLTQTGSRGEWVRCSYRWTFRPCPHCEVENDIAARYCTSCRGEIIDPNEKLQIEFKALKRDPTKPQTDEVVAMSWKEGVSRNNNKTLRVNVATPYRAFEVFLMPEAEGWRQKKSWEAFMTATDSMKTKPRTVTYQKNAETKFFEVLGYNRPADVDPTKVKEVA